MKEILLFAFALSISLSCVAQLTPVAVSGLTADVVADGSGTVAASTTMDADGASFAFVAHGYVNPSGLSPTTGLPANGIINSAATSGVTYQLAAYTTNNSLRIAGVGTGTLTFPSPRSADQIYVLATSGSGISTVTFTVTFTDATSQAFTQTVKDWYGGTGYAIQGIGRVSRATNSIENSGTDPRLYEFLLTLSTPNTAKPIQSITFNKTSTTGVLNVMAVTARFVTPPMPNDIGVSAIAGLTSGCALTSQETITATISNTGTAAQSNFPVSYRVNNGPAITETFSGTVAPFSTATHTFAAKANLSATGTHTIVAKTGLSTDGNANNDSTIQSVVNSLLPALPVMLDFEGSTTGLGVFQTTIGTNAGIAEGVGASNGTISQKGLIMDGKTYAGWVIPGGATDPWATNTNNLATARICIDPAGGNANDPLWLSFDLKQLYKTANANTNFRILVNGQAIGGNQVSPANTYRPPFMGNPITWERINLDLTTFKTQPSLEIAFESNVMEEYANGTGTANLIDNIMVRRSAPAGVKTNKPENLVQVFPNPSSGVFRINATISMQAVEVQDLTGKTVLKHNLEKENATIDLKNATKGIYLLKLSSENETVFKRLIIE